MRGSSDSTPNFPEARGARVEGRQAAAGKVIVHLGADGLGRDARVGFPEDVATLRVAHQGGELVGRVDGLHGLHDTELFDGLMNTCTPTHTRGIDQGVGDTISFKGNLYAVTGCTRLIKNNHPFFPQHTIYER